MPRPVTTARNLPPISRKRTPLSAPLHAAAREVDLRLVVTPDEREAEILGRQVGDRHAALVDAPDDAADHAGARAERDLATPVDDGEGAVGGARLRQLGRDGRSRKEQGKQEWQRPSA